MQYLQQVIHDIHALVAHEPDPEAKATVSKCLPPLLALQAKKMQPTGPQYSNGSGPTQQAQGGTAASGIYQALQGMGGGR